MGKASRAKKSSRTISVVANGIIAADGPHDSISAPRSRPGSVGVEGPRIFCRWCKASIPFSLTPLLTPVQQEIVRLTTKPTDIIDVHRGVKSSIMRYTHRMTAWCSVCEVYAEDRPIEIG